MTKFRKTKKLVSRHTKDFQAISEHILLQNCGVGMIIGSAFTALVTSLVNSIFMPLISLITGGIDFKDWNIPLTSGSEPPTLALGDFLSAILNFLIVAFCIFMVIKAFNKFHNMSFLKKKSEEAAAPSVKICPFCKSEIAVDATRCPHCTSVLEEDASR